MSRVLQEAVFSDLLGRIFNYLYIVMGVLLAFLIDINDFGVG